MLIGLLVEKGKLCSAPDVIISVKCLTKILLDCRNGIQLASLSHFIPLIESYVAKLSILLKALKEASLFFHFKRRRISSEHNFRNVMFVKVMKNTKSTSSFVTAFGMRNLCFQVGKRSSKESKVMAHTSYVKRILILKKVVHHLIHTFDVFGLKKV